MKNLRALARQALRHKHTPHGERLARRILDRIAGSDPSIVVIRQTVDADGNDNSRKDDVIQFDRTDGLADEVIDFLSNEGVIEASSSSFKSGVLYRSEGQMDFHSGDTTSYSFALKDFTPDEERAIFDGLNL